jgi:hypothetical protein
LKEEDRKDEVIKVNEEERSSEEEVISSSLSPSFCILTPSLIPPRHPPYFIPLVSLLPLHRLFTILPPFSLSFSLYSFLPALFSSETGIEEEI